MILSWISILVIREIASSIIFIDSAEEVWKELKERSLQGNRPKIFHIKKTIVWLCQHDTSESDYSTKLKELRDELLNYIHVPSCSCGSMKMLYEIPRIRTANTVLDGNNSLHTLEDICCYGPHASKNKAFALARQEE